jgi:hypothetical protein
MGTIGFLQLVVFMPLIGIMFPANAKILTDALTAIATFDMLPTDDIFPAILDF